MKYKNNKIALIFFPITIVLAALATSHASYGTYHYGPFILAPIIIYDGIKSYVENKMSWSKPISLVQIAIGAFIFTEHLYLVQVFWQGIINF